MKKILPLVGENDPFDESKYFFICLSALGSPGSCSPSSTNLKNKFPGTVISMEICLDNRYLNQLFKLKGEK